MKTSAASSELKIKTFLFQLATAEIIYHALTTCRLRLPGVFKRKRSVSFVNLHRSKVAVKTKDIGQKS